MGEKRLFVKFEIGYIVTRKNKIIALGTACNNMYKLA